MELLNCLQLGFFVDQASHRCVSTKHWHRVVLLFYLSVHQFYALQLCLQYASLVVEPIYLHSPDSSKSS